MHARTVLTATLAITIAAAIAGIATKAQGSSSQSQSWALLPSTLAKTATPNLKGAKRLTVFGSNFAATSIDNPPTGTSQGDELAVSAHLLTAAGKDAGTLDVHEVLTAAANGSAQRIMLTATATLAGGQISAVGVQRMPQQGTRLAIVGGTGQYWNVRGGQLTAGQGPNNTAKLTFLLIRR